MKYVSSTLSEDFPSLEDCKHVFVLVLRVICCYLYVFPFWLWKYVEVETFHGRLHHWFLIFFIGIDTLEPLPLHPSLSSNLFMVTFITYSWVYFFMTSWDMVSYSSWHKTKTIRHSFCSSKRKLISDQIKLNHIIL